MIIPKNPKKIRQKTVKILAEILALFVVTAFLECQFKTVETAAVACFATNNTDR